MQTPPRAHFNPLEGFQQGNVTLDVCGRMLPNLPDGGKCNIDRDGYNKEIA